MNGGDGACHLTKISGASRAASTLMVFVGNWDSWSDGVKSDDCLNDERAASALKIEGGDVDRVYPLVHDVKFVLVPCVSLHDCYCYLIAFLFPSEMNLIHSRYLLDDY